MKQRENNPDVKMIIFTEFIETQKYIQETLENMGYSTACINGKMGLEEKILQKNRFKDEAQFLISTDAGGEGINLQFCSHMVNYDLPWNPMKLEQRIGRIDRIGQKEDVKVFNLILKDTIEEHVRGILEEKLEIIREQFGEDKLRDILSTLQEDFNFDQIYIDAITTRAKETKKLDKVAREIYEKAQIILKEEEFLIPFTSGEKIINDEEKKIINKMPVKIKTFIESFLAVQGDQLQEYSNQPDIYYFKNNFKTNKYEKHFSKVIFDPAQGLENEEADLLSLKHDYTLDAINNAKGDGIVSAFYIQDSRFKDKGGLLGFWQLKVENNYDYRRTYYIPIFIEKDTGYNRRISRLFENIENINIGNAYYLSGLEDKDGLYQQAIQEAEKEAEAIFLEELLKWQEKIEARSKQLEEYYQGKEKAIMVIKIDNIRESRLKMLKKEWEEKERELKEKANLFPALSCEQLAYIEYR